MSVVLKVENVSKKYHLGKTGTSTLKGDFKRWWALRQGKEDPFSKVFEASQIQGEAFWALKDINFEIRQGEAVGIIGKNGAGKSTLLKILSRITLPTTGNIKVKGRIASLLEVGTGFNPDLSGRENIYLNGSILGMTKAEITRKFDEIVDFSGVERFINTPVKRYSSGMYVRLAFAVAAHLDSEILILDEVLAVGDAEFQKKCLGKMDDVAHHQGRTVLFVSHGMDAVRKLCNSSILLNKGTIDYVGNTISAIERYKGYEVTPFIQSSLYDRQLNEYVVLKEFAFHTKEVASFVDISFTIALESTDSNRFDGLTILFYDKSDLRIAIADLRNNDLFEITSENQFFTVRGILKEVPLVPGEYMIGLSMGSALCTGNFLDLIMLKVVENYKIQFDSPYPTNVRGFFEIKHQVNVVENNLT